MNNEAISVSSHYSGFHRSIFFLFTSKLIRDRQKTQKEIVILQFPKSREICTQNIFSNSKRHKNPPNNSYNTIFKCTGYFFFPHTQGRLELHINSTS